MNASQLWHWEMRLRLSTCNKWANPVTVIRVYVLCGDDGDTSSMLNYHRKVHLFIHFALFTIFISRGKLRIFFSKTVYVMFVCRALTDSKYCQLFNRVKTSENISSNRKSVNCNIYNIRYIYSKTKMTLYILHYWSVRWSNLLFVLFNKFKYCL